MSAADRSCRQAQVRARRWTARHAEGERDRLASLGRGPEKPSCTALRGSSDGIAQASMHKLGEVQVGYASVGRDSYSYTVVRYSSCT